MSHPVGLELVETPYDDAVVQQLTREVQAEYARRHGGSGDTTPIDPEQFVAPGGYFVLAMLDGTAVGMGGWRGGGPNHGDAEIKRMFVREQWRGTGIARVILGALERSAGLAGFSRLVLETGRAQPEAIALYRSAGFVDVAPFGHYADSPDAVHLAKQV